MVYKTQHLVKVLQMGLQALGLTMEETPCFGFNHGGNSVVKHAQAGVVLGWVTSRVLHLCEHHLDPMSAKCSIYSHERWIHVESLLMKHWSSSLTQKSHS